jgi:integrase
LELLKAEVRCSRKAAYSSGTLKNIHLQWETFLLFCQKFSLKPLPVEPYTLSLYAQFLARSFRSVKSIQNYVNGIKLLHSFSHFSFPSEQLWEYKIVLKGIEKNLNHVVSRALPITPQILLEIFHLLSMDDPVDVTFWALFLVAFFCMLRKSNLVPLTSAKFDASKQLTRSDITMLDSVLLVQVKWSKTVQTKNRRFELPLPAIEHSPLCPVQAFKRMVKLIPVPPTYPAFCLPSRHSHKPITYHQFHKFLRKFIAHSGRDPTKFSSHSFRRGGATWAFQCNVPAELIKVQGDWRSDAYQRYLEFDFEDRAKVAKAMGCGISNDV